MACPFRAILSPIQFDDLSLPALGFAKSIAKDQGATLHLLHVVAMASALGEPAINATLHSRAEEKAIEVLNDIAAKHLVWRPANNFLKAVESESQFFRAKAADKPSKIVKLFAGRDTRRRQLRNPHALRLTQRVLQE
jgi:nucleotide-binding universal stress UspA family protein